jgi:hypothetical protein
MIAGELSISTMPRSSMTVTTINGNHSRAYEAAIAINSEVVRLRRRSDVDGTASLVFR